MPVNLAEILNINQYQTCATCGNSGSSLQNQNYKHSEKQTTAVIAKHPDPAD
jgi:hypothetical protein